MLVVSEIGSAAETSLGESPIPTRQSVVFGLVCVTTRRRPSVLATRDVYRSEPEGSLCAIRRSTSTLYSHGPEPSESLARGSSTCGLPPWRQDARSPTGDIQHKNLWLIDLETGAERQLTNFSPNFDIREFDISQDGRELVLERVQERSDVVLLDLSHQ
jgi:hypothetical protein